MRVAAASHVEGDALAVAATLDRSSRFAPDPSSGGASRVLLLPQGEKEPG
jgi:hypothetical protein